MDRTTHTSRTHYRPAFSISCKHFVRPTADSLVYTISQWECRTQRCRSSRLKIVNIPYMVGWAVCTVMIAVGLNVKSVCPSCHHQADRMGHHSYVCGSGGEQISRHNALREGLIRLAREAGQNPQREARFLLPGLDRRPADLLIPFGTGTLP